MQRPAPHRGIDERRDIRHQLERGHGIDGTRRPPRLAQRTQVLLGETHVEGRDRVWSWAKDCAFIATRCSARGTEASRAGVVEGRARRPVGEQGHASDERMGLFPIFEERAYEREYAKDVHASCQVYVSFVSVRAADAAQPAAAVARSECLDVCLRCR